MTVHIVIPLIRADHGPSYPPLGGEHAPPITGPTGIGIRGDNLEFTIDDLAVR